jgi:hypothetical protein
MPEGPAQAPPWVLELVTAPPGSPNRRVAGDDASAEFVLDEDAKLPIRARQLLENDLPQASFSQAFHHHARKPDSADSSDSGWDHFLREFLRRCPDATDQEPSDRPR